MALYSKLAYAGAILAIFKYGSFFGIFLSMYYLVPEKRHLAVLIGSSPEMTYMMDLGLGSGLVGIVVSIIVIVTVKKVNFLKKKLSFILIFTGSVFFILSWFAFSFISGIVNNVVTTSSTNVWSAIAMTDNNTNQIYEGMNQQLMIEMIPSILLLVSGLLAFRIYRKTKNTIPD